MAFPLLRQRDRMQCGVACLAMICKYYGLEMSFFEMESYCPISKNGVSLLAIAEAAGKLGFSTTSGKYTLEQIRQMPSPCILHWNQNHFVVLYKVTKRYFYIADPAKGLMRYSEKDFINQWMYGASSDGENTINLGIALALSPNGTFRIRRQASDRSLGSLWPRIIGYFTRYKHYFLLLGIGLILNSLLQILMPFLTQAIVDKGINQRNINIIWIILAGELMIVGGMTISSFVQNWIVVHISVRINVTMIYDFFSKLLRLPMSFFDTRLLGDLMQRMGDYGRIQSFLGGEILSVIISLFSFAILSVVLLIYNLPIFIIFCIGSIVYGVWIAVFLSRRKALDYEFFEKQATNNNVTYQLLANMQEIKLQSCEKRRIHEWVGAQMSLFTSQIRLLALQQIQDSGSLLINETKNILITIYAATAVIDGGITLGEMLAIQYIVGQLQSPVSSLLRLINSVQDVKISFDRINDVHSLKDENHDRSNVPDEKFTDFSFEIKNLDFKYHISALDWTLKDINIEIPSGKMTAIVGASGCGKSTLVKLLLAYYRPLGGEILLSGKNLDEINADWLRQKCGVILQDGVIFSESIAQNIAIQREDFNMDEVVKAAKIAEIYDFVKGLPMGFQTRIGNDGLGLSQGQKQRILIARAVYKSPSLVIMDEATNSLDATTEKSIVGNLSKFLQNRTSIVIAHRLSTVKNADNIIVMDNGKIVETGSHDILISKRGHYFNLVKDQLEAYG